MDFCSCCTPASAAESPSPHPKSQTRQNYTQPLGGFREIQARELAVILDGGAVVCPGGVDFVVEAAEVYCFVLKSYAGLPFAIVLFPGNSFVFRLRWAGTFFSVGGILGMCCGSEVCACVVHTIVIDMIDEHFMRDFDNLAVHGDNAGVSRFGFCGVSYCVEAVSSFFCNPFVLAQAFVVGRVHLCVFRLGHANPPKGIPVPRPPIQKHQPDDYAFEPIENVNTSFDLPTPQIAELLISR